MSEPAESRPPKVQQIEWTELITGHWTVEQLETQKELRSGHDNQRRSILQYHLNMKEVQWLEVQIAKLREERRQRQIQSSGE